MKSNPKVIDTLNALLAEELTAVNQYMVHSKIYDDWGYARLHLLIKKRAIDEIKHAEKLIGRILFLEGMPIVSELGKIHIGSTVEVQLQDDLGAEQGAVNEYNAGIRVMIEAGDNGTAELLKAILKDEEAHLDWIQSQLDQIAQMGAQNYLSMQVE